MSGRVRQPQHWPALTATVALLAVGALTGCGSSKGLSAADFIDNQRVEASIEASALQQRGKRVDAACPALVRIKKGGTFVCTATAGKAVTRFKVTMRDEKGTVRYVAVTP